MKTPYHCIKAMLNSAEWARDFYFDLGLFELAIKYQKIATRLRNTLWSFPAINIERSYKALEKGRGRIEQSKNLLAK